jgi:tripartite-type tricarboxylate transporter receptor subunit TctC
MRGAIGSDYIEGSASSDMNPLRIGLVCTVLAILAPGNAKADDADFYRGKTLNLLIGSGVGGGLDQVVRAVARHLSKHVPGNPTVVPRNMIGAGGLQVLNFVQTVAPKDGTTIGVVLPALVFEPLVAGKTSAEGFDPRKLRWLGGPARYASVAVAWNPATPVRKAEDLLTQELVVGAASAASNSATDGYVMRSILGFKYRTVTGYPSGADLDLAMIRGETQGRANIAWYGIKTRNSEWLSEGKISLLYQMGLKKHPDIPREVPLSLDLTRTPAERQVLELKFSAYDVGYAFMAPPETPTERVTGLRAAMTATFNDPAYRADAVRERLELDPVSGEEVEAIVRNAYGASPEIIARLVEAAKPPR